MWGRHGNFTRGRTNTYVHTAAGNCQVLVSPPMNSSRVVAPTHDPPTIAVHTYCTSIHSLFVIAVFCAAWCGEDEEEEVELAAAAAE